ncbi:MAG: PA2779 family protein [Thermodesulfovibrionia bacterium]|nr:PA2779 family protein [Thermodesulfovibrionia bacterium]
MKYITWFLVITMFLIGIAPRVDAGLSPSEVIAVSQTDRTSDLQKIQEFLEMKLIRERLEKFGFTQDEIQARLNQLSDQQIHYFAQNLDDLQVGGDGLGIIIALLVIAILVVLLFQLTGHKVIVTK